MFSSDKAWYSQYSDQDTSWIVRVSIPVKASDTVFLQRLKPALGPTQSPTEGYHAAGGKSTGACNKRLICTQWQC